MKYLINGIVDIVKLVVVLYAVFYAFESGIVDYIVSLFK
jgi:phage shock protein PspC (stress-responsive transcriptional regulator)